MSEPTTSTTTLVSTTGSNSAPMTLEDATKAVETAKDQINQCDQQNSIYKAALRNLTANDNSSDTTTNDNSVTIEWVKVDMGAKKSAEAAPSKLILQLSSPVEEATLYLPSSSSSAKGDAATKGSSKVVFTSVETGQATLSITADTSSSTPSEVAYMDVSKFTHELLDALQSPPKSYEKTIQVPILPLKQKDDTSPGDSSNSNADPVCTITLHIIYVPSTKDIRETLCEQIGKIATTKAIAREELRKASLAVHQLASTSSTGTSSKPAVKPGFLQKDASKEGSTTKSSFTQSKVSKLFKTLESYYATTSTIIVPVLKNYVYFVAFTVVMHYYGHHLAIPAPV